MRAAKADHAEPIKIDSHRRRIVLIYPGIKDADMGWNDALADIANAKADPVARYLESRSCTRSANAHPGSKPTNPGTTPPSPAILSRSPSESHRSTYSPTTTPTSTQSTTAPSTANCSTNCATTTAEAERQSAAQSGRPSQLEIQTRRRSPAPCMFTPNGAGQPVRGTAGVRWGVGTDPDHPTLTEGFVCPPPLAALRVPLQPHRLARSLNRPVVLPYRGRHARAGRPARLPRRGQVRYLERRRSRRPRRRGLPHLRGERLAQRRPYRFLGPSSCSCRAGMHRPAPARSPLERSTGLSRSSA